MIWRKIEAQMDAMGREIEARKDAMVREMLQMLTGKISDLFGHLNDHYPGGGAVKS